MNVSMVTLFYSGLHSNTVILRYRVQMAGHPGNNDITVLLCLVMRNCKSLTDWQKRTVLSFTLGTENCQEYMGNKRVKGTQLTASFK